MIRRSGVQAFRRSGAGLYSSSVVGLILFLNGGSPALAADTIIKNATVLTVTKGTIQNGDVLIRDGKVAGIGRNLRVPAGAKVIDATGKFVMPGIIDAHSHMAIEGGINEGTEVISAEVDINDVINEKDNGIKWALAGGVTTINTMHGSANPIGGIAATLKLRWGKNADELKFAGARRHIKFALGENPKRVHAERGVTTRLGVAETLRQQFTAAREYMRDWDDYNRKKLAGDNPLPPRRDIKLDNIASVLKGETWLQAHCYRADEIEMLLKLSDEFGFKIGALQHVLEGYKVAPEIASRGFGASTFADFWGYKLEAYDGISYNPAAMTQWGVRASVNSDSGERIRRLNLDAAKSLRYGGLTDDQCLALITINPAWQLGVDKQTGSIEVGKDADLGVWDAHPLSVYAKCVTTLVDGQVYFSRSSDGTATFGATTDVRPPTTALNPQSAIRNPQSGSVTRQPSSVAFPPAHVTAKPSAPATFAITNVRIVPVSSPEIPRGTIVVENGRITQIGPDVTVSSGIKTVNARGYSVYPGFINAAGTLGLTEISSVPESQDLGEQGPLKAHLRAADAFNAHSAHVGVARMAGVTSTLVAPRGQGWMGQASLMHTAGRTVEESTVAADFAHALGLSGGGFGRRGGGGEGGINPVEDPAAAQARTNIRQTVEKALDDSRDYGRAVDAYKRSADPSNRPPKPDLTLAALVPAARKLKPVIMSASSADDIEQAVKFGGDKSLQVIVTGGRDADKAAASLNKSGVPVIFTDLLSMPVAGDAYDKNFSAPRRILEAGIKFCIAAAETPTLALHAGMAAAFGLPRDEALKAITLYPAQILGVERDLGSLEVGKIADLLITDGDPLEFRTEIKRIYINGVEAPLTSRHRQLYDEFRRKK